MTTSDIRAFFDGYARAFTAQDAVAICDHYAFPVQILSEEAGYVFRHQGGDAGRHDRLRRLL
jgi:ketosteroid isomerase-like protein